MRAFVLTTGFAACFASASAATAQSPGCAIPPVAQAIWRCENGFVIGPEDVIVRLPIPETDPEELYRAGLESAQRADWPAAIAYFSAAHHRAHLVPRYMYNLGIAHARAGHDVLAIGWLASYLTASPGTANAPAVWREIAALDATARRRSGELWRQTDRVVEALPRVGPNGGAKRAGYINLTILAARSGDIERGKRYFAQALKASTDDPGKDAGLEKLLREASLGAAIEDGDRVLAEQLIGELGAEATDSESRADLARLRAGQSPDRRTRNMFTPAFFRRGRQCNCPVLEAAWRFDPKGLREASEAHVADGNVTTRLSALAALGNRTPALSGIAAIESNSRESAAATISEVLLLTGNLDSARTARDAALEARLSDRSGAPAARAEGLIAIEEGNTETGIAIMEAAFSRLGATSRPNWVRMITYTPRADWDYHRFDPVGLATEFLVLRGRGAEAMVLSKRLDTLRRARLFEEPALAPYWRAGGGVPESVRDAILSEAAGGDSALVARRIAIEIMLAAVYALPDTLYDLPRWMQYVRAADSPVDQTLGIGSAAQDTPRGLRMIRAAYRLNGGTWPQ